MDPASPRTVARAPGVGPPVLEGAAGNMVSESAVRDRAARARTRPGRLAACDRWLEVREADLLREPRHGASPVVDVGFGGSPVTTVELAARVWAIAPGCGVVGYEVDSARAEAAVGASRGTALRFLRGGFQEVVRADPLARVIRVMNVLRSYPASESAPVHRLLGGALVEGGLLMEGTSDTDGHVLTAWLKRRRGDSLDTEGLLVFTDFARGFGPWLFRDFLPKDSRRAVVDGSWLRAWFEQWERCWSEVRVSGTRSAAELFRLSLSGLSSERGDIDPCSDLGNGFALWRCASSGGH